MKKKKIKKIILIVFLLILAFVTIYFLILRHNAKEYIYDKYGITSVEIVDTKLPYYPDTADFFDWPILYKPGELEPFTVYFTDGEKEFTVMHIKGKYYDDYQIEEISELCTNYFRKLTGDDEIQYVLFNYSAVSNSPDDYDRFNNFLKTNNQLWTEENVDEFIKMYIQNNIGYMSIYCYDSFEDISVIKSNVDKIYETITKQFATVIGDTKSTVIKVAYSNHELDIGRVNRKKYNNVRDFDYYGLKEEQEEIWYRNIKNDKNPDMSDKLLVFYQ
jgi:hypothetical protein